VSGAGRAQWSRRLDDLVAGCTLLARVPAFLRRSIRPSDAREIVQRRLAHREADFLALVRREVFDLARDPYRALLRHAGCEFGDLERLTRTEGVEGGWARWPTTGSTSPSTSSRAAHRSDAER